MSGSALTWSADVQSSQSFIIEALTKIAPDFLAEVQKALPNLWVVRFEIEPSDDDDTKAHILLCSSTDDVVIQLTVDHDTDADDNPIGAFEVSLDVLDDWEEDHKSIFLTNLEKETQLTLAQFVWQTDWTRRATVWGLWAAIKNTVLSLLNS